MIFPDAKKHIGKRLLIKGGRPTDLVSAVEDRIIEVSPSATNIKFETLGWRKFTEVELVEVLEPTPPRAEKTPI